MTYAIFIVKRKEAKYIGMYVCETSQEAIAEENRLNDEIVPFMRSGYKFSLVLQ